MTLMDSFFETSEKKRQTRYRAEKIRGNRIRSENREGRKFTFHGSFTEKAKAKAKEKEVGGFIREKNGRYYVLKEK